MRLQDVFGEDLERLGIFPGRFAKEGDPRYVYPPFINLLEAGDTYFPVTWTMKGIAEIGQFTINEDVFQILIEPFPYSSGEVDYNCANVSFVRLIDGEPSIEMISPSVPAQQVISTVTNAISGKIVRLDLDAITLVATNVIASRMKLYNRIADKYMSSFGTVYKNIKTLTGTMTLIISHRVPIDAQHTLIEFAKQQSANKQ